MTKYEYNTIFNSEHLTDKFLNHMGEDGWELVSHDYQTDRHMHYYVFKREKKEDPTLEDRPKD